MTRRRRTAKKELRRRFSFLRSADFFVTSRRTSTYNCIAWAAGDTNHWWQAELTWPAGVPLDGGLQAAVELFRRLGYDVCATTDLEPGQEKVAIYAEPRGYSHVARQLEDGWWTSKLGTLEDVSHKTPAVVEQLYGPVAVVMRRPRGAGPTAPGA